MLSCTSPIMWHSQRFILPTWSLYFRRVTSSLWLTWRIALLKAGEAGLSSPLPSTSFHSSSSLPCPAPNISTSALWTRANGELCCYAEFAVVACLGSSSVTQFTINQIFINQSLPTDLDTYIIYLFGKYVVRCVKRILLRWTASGF